MNEPHPLDFPNVGAYLQAMNRWRLMQGFPPPKDTNQDLQYYQQVQQRNASTPGQAVTAGQQKPGASQTNLRASSPWSFAGMKMPWEQGGGAVQQAQDSANRANAYRLQSILGGIAGMGVSERTRIATGAARSQSEIKQSLINRGLGNSTVVGPMMQQVQNQANLNNIDLSDRLTAARNGVLERVQTQGPNYELLADYQRRASRGNGGSNTSGYRY